MYTDYELFVAIVEEGSLAKAGRLMNLSRPVVTKRLARLEDRLGVRLLHRTTRRMLTTKEGQAFYEQIKTVVVAAKEAEAQVAAWSTSPVQSGLRGELKVRTVNSIARKLLGPMLGSFIRQHPEIRINVLVVDQPIDLLTDRVDAEITFAPPSWQGAVVETLAPDRRILCAAPEYLARKGTPSHPEDLYEHDILASPVSLPWRLVGPNGTFNYHGKTMIITNSGELPGTLAVTGLGIALRPVWAMLDELRTGQLVRVLPDYESDSYWAIRATTHVDRPRSAALQAFIAHLKASFAELEPNVNQMLAEIQDLTGANTLPDTDHPA